MLRQRHTLSLAYRLLKYLDIQVVPDGLHAAALLGAEKVAGSAQFQVAHGYFEAAAELGEFADGLEAFCGYLA